MSVPISSARVKQGLDALRRRMDQQPVRRTLLRDRIYALFVIGGNTLTSGQNGIKRVSAQTSCPVAYDPEVDTSYADGWGNAYGYFSNPLEPRKVLICHDGALDTLIEGWEVFSLGPVFFPVGSSSDVVMAFRVFTR